MAETCPGELFETMTYNRHANASPSYTFVLYLVITGNDFCPFWRHAVPVSQHPIWSLHLKIEFSHQMTIK